MKELTIFERIELLVAKGIQIKIKAATTSYLHYMVEVTYLGELVFGIRTADLEAGLKSVVNEMELHHIYEYFCTNNREGYVVAKDFNEAAWKVTFHKGIAPIDVIGVSKVQFIPNQAISLEVVSLAAQFK